MTEVGVRPLPLLDARLSCIAQQVPVCRVAADIGADHGRLSCWLLAKGRCDKMIVSDTSPLSRGKARDLFISYGLMERVILSGEDGLKALHGSPEAIIICGMGAGSIIGILSQEVPLQGARLILSAQTELPLLREAVGKKGYCIQKEHVGRANGRFYLIMSAEPGRQRLTDTQRALGINMTDTPSASVRDYLLWQQTIAGCWRGLAGEMYRGMIQEVLSNETSDSQDRSRLA